MQALLVRVAADQSAGGGYWNGPADSVTRLFVYVAIPESSPTHPGLNKPYAGLHLPLLGFEATLPPHLLARDMHLDPDFDHLTYGDEGARAKQIQATLGKGDLLVFYAGMRDVPSASSRLVYGIIGLYVVEDMVSALLVPPVHWHQNAHTRKVLVKEASDLVVRARPGVSGRLERYIPIGHYHHRAYRVCPELLDAWGGLKVKDGWLQRSARLPEFLDANTFYNWFLSQNVTMVRSNN
jgi:hypothetical protein